MDMLQEVFGGPWGPLLIFGLRLIDVSLSTLRILFMVRGRRYLGPFIGFVEVLIWLFAAGNAIQYLDSPLHVLGYAGGFAAGTALGTWVEEKLAIGLARVQALSPYGGVELAEALRAEGFGVTEFLGQGREGRVEMVSTIAPRSKVRRVLELIDLWEPDAFVTLDEPRAAHRGWMYRAQRK